MNNNYVSFSSGYKRFIEHYGEVNRRNIAEFLGLREVDVYNNIIKPYKYYKGRQENE